MRSFIRHSATMPLKVKSNEKGSQKQSLQNVSAGGLCFHSNYFFPQGVSVNIDIPYLDTPFNESCTVVWCKKTTDHYDVGVTFDSYQTVLRMRLIEQICYIEDYRKEVFNSEQREISADEASREWFQKYADRIFKV